jgi:hypothetical protein
MTSESGFLVGRRRAIPQFVAVRNGTCDSYLISTCEKGMTWVESMLDTV